MLDCAALLGVGVWFKRKIKPLRLLGGVAAGVLGGICSLFFSKYFWLYLIVNFLLVNPIMLLIAFPCSRKKQFAVYYVTALAVNFFFSGVYGFLCPMLPENAQKVILPIACVLMLLLVFWLSHGTKKREPYKEVSFFADGYVGRLTALCDTGNVLRDPLTNYAVCIISEEYRDNMKKTKKPLRRIRYQTVSGEDSIEICPVTKFYLHENGQMEERKRVMLGFGKKSLFTGKKYQMILHRDFC